MAIAALCLAGSVIVPAAAQGAQGFTVDFRLPPDRGVHVYFQASGGSFDGALFSAFRNDHRAGASSTYFKVGRGVGEGISQDRIDLDFGRRGRVETEFAETGRNRLHVPGCEGYILARRGEFTGTVRFRGEHGYAVTRARRTGGHVYVDHLRNCNRGGGGGGKAPRSTVLRACLPDESREYGALVNERFGFSLHFANEWERRDGVVISRDAVWSGKPRAFEASGESEATVRPGGLFRGSGVVSDERLQGDLAVKLLGHRRPQELTPARATLKVTRDWSTRGCPMPEPFGAVQRGRVQAATLMRRTAVGPGPAARSALTPTARRLLVPGAGPPLLRP